MEVQPFSNLLFLKLFKNNLLMLRERVDIIMVHLPIRDITVLGLKIQRF